MSHPDAATTPSRYGCSHPDCDRHPSKGDAITRTSPKGQPFAGRCSEHLDVPDPDAATTAAEWLPPCRHCGHKALHHYIGHGVEGCQVGGCHCGGFGTPLPNTRDPDPATAAAANFMRNRGVRGQSWEDLARGAIAAAMPHLVPSDLQARTLLAAGRMLEHDQIIKLARDVGAVYPNPGADSGPLREALQRSPYLPFADLLDGDGDAS